LIPASLEKLIYQVSRGDYLYGASPIGTVFVSLAHVWLCSISNVSDDPQGFVVENGVI